MRSLLDSTYPVLTEVQAAHGAQRSSSLPLSLQDAAEAAEAAEAQQAAAAQPTHDSKQRSKVGGTPGSSPPALLSRSCQSATPPPLREFQASEPALE